MNLNKAIIVGNITRDPELKAMPTGKSVCNFSIATNRMWMDANNQKQKEVEFHNIVIFGKMADTVAQYMKKGSTILVEGRIKTRSWESQDGQKKYRTEIIAESVQFGPRPQTAPAPTATATQTDEPPEQTGEEGEVNAADIPF